MRLKLVRQGRRFTVYALDLSNDPNSTDCPALEFFENMNQASQKSMTNVLMLHADQGPLRNVQKSRHLEDEIFEFKSRQGDRILWFYEPGGRTILTHGFQKKATYKEEIDRAKRLRAQWEATK